MTHIQSDKALSVAVQCRFEVTEQARPDHEFCVFEFPGCDGCPNALHVMKTVGRSEDPLKTAVWQELLAEAFRPKR